jgi:hypothetical protein
MASIIGCETMHLSSLGNGDLRRDDMASALREESSRILLWRHNVTRGHVMARG